MWRSTARRFLRLCWRAICSGTSAARLPARRCRKRGRLEVADGGVVFLDEIGELAPALQVKLLRVLQEREFERVGGTHTIKVDIRLIAATNRDLIDARAQRAVSPGFVLPAGGGEADRCLRCASGREDIPMLARHFVQKYAKRSKVKTEAGIARGHGGAGELRVAGERARTWRMRSSGRW